MTLSNRIIFGVCLFGIVLTAGFIASGKVVLDRVESALLLLSGDNVTAAAQAVLERSEKPLAAHGKTISRDRAAIAALANGEFESVAEGLASTFNRISAAGEISDLQIFDVEGQLAASFTTAEEAQTVQELPALVATVREQGRRSFEITRVGQNRYAAAYAFPLLKGRTPIGYALLALDVETTLAAIATTVGGAAILIAVTSENQFEVLRSEGFSSETIESEAETNAQSTQIHIAPEKIASAALSSLGKQTQTVGTVQTEGESFVTARYRLGPIANNASLEMLLISDFTSEHAAKTQTIQTALAGIGSVVVLFLAVMLFWLRHQMRPLKDITNALLAVAKGESPQRRDARNPAREIADLGSAT